LRKILVVSTVLILFLLSSCVTAGAVIRSNFEGRPVWYYIPESQVRKGRTVFMGEGRATNERQARLLAFSNLFENIEFYFGTELEDEYYRELTVLQTIGDYDLSVSDSDVSYENGSYTVLLRATANTELIEKSRTESALNRQVILDQIYKLTAEGVEYMKSSMDLSAARKYMEAMLLAWNNKDVKEAYSFDSLLDECVRILDSVELNISSVDSKKATCLVSVFIKEGKLTSLVPSCSVIAKYHARSIDGKAYEDSFSFRTSEDGSFVFRPLNYSLERKGTVVLSLDVEDCIVALEKKAGKEAVSKLRSAFEAKKVSFDYEFEYTDKTVGLVMMDFDISGEQMGNEFSGNYFKQKFDEAGIRFVELTYDNSLENPEILKKYKESFADPGYLFISRIAVTDSIESKTGESIVSCEGSFSIYDTTVKDPIKGSEMIYSTAFGETQLEAQQKAFMNLADLFFSFLRSVYV